MAIMLQSLHLQLFTYPDGSSSLSRDEMPIIPLRDPPDSRLVLYSVQTCWNWIVCSLGIVILDVSFPLVPGSSITFATWKFSFVLLVRRESVGVDEGVGSWTSELVRIKENRS